MDLRDIHSSIATTRKREAWLDRWKGILIILVVLGHISGGAYHFAHGASQSILQYIFKLIYAFHMPAFFFIAGYLYKDSERWFVKKIQRLIVPYFVFGACSIVLYCFMQNGIRALLLNAESTAFYSNHFVAQGMGGYFLSLIQGGGWPKGEGFRCNSVLWFLPCMFVSLNAFRYVHRYGLKCVFMISCIIVIGIGMPGGLPWGLSLAPWYCVFICLGWFAKRYSLFSINLSNRRKMALLLGMIIFYLVLVLFLPNPSHLRRHADGRIVLMLIAIGGCFISGIIANTIRGIWLEYIGISSLGIMLTHKFLVVGIQTKLRLFKIIIDASPLLAVLSVLLVSIIVTAVCMALTWLIKRWFPWALGEFRRKYVIIPCVQK